MKFVNLPVPMLETYSDQCRIVKQPAHIYTSGMLALKSMNWNIDVWYCMITTQTSLKVFNIKSLLGITNLKKIRNGKLFLVIDLSFEPFYKCVDTIYKEVVIKHKIPSDQVIFISNMYDASEYNKLSAKKYKRKPIRNLWFSSLEFMLNEYKGPIPDTLQDKEYNKKYLSFNRRWREHRPLLVLLLYHNKLLKHGHVSFGPCEHHGNWDDIWDGLKVNAIGNQEMFDSVMASESIKSMTPLYLDTDELHTNRAELTDSTKKYYEDTYFSVIAETTYFNKYYHLNSRFITEKTFKAIVMKHPFILVSIPRSLRVLKELGYKTFSPWINEDYDEEMDDNKRMMMIIKEIDRLCNLPKDELSKFLVAMREICEYNFNVIKNKKVFIARK